MGRFDWLTARPVAHRGLHDADRGIVENTESAIAAAMEAGYAIELDLQLAGDGEAVVFHDETLDRLTVERGDVLARSTAELKSVAFRQTADRIQTLPELLEQVDGAVPLVLETKSSWTAPGPLEQRIAECLEHYDGPVALMSFDPGSVARFVTLCPGRPRGLVAERFTAAEWPQIGALKRMCLTHLLCRSGARPDFINYNVRHLPAPAPWLARRLGLPLLTWTVRSPEDRRTAARWADAMVFEGFRP